MCTTLVVGILLHNFGDTEDITNFEMYKGDGDREDITNFEVSKGDVDNCSPVRIIYGNTTTPGEDLFYREFCLLPQRIATTTQCWLEHVKALII